jgi:hypothetical protein
MSYQYLSAIGQPKESGGRWQEIDVAGSTFTEIFESYRQAKIMLGHTSYEGLKHIDLEALRQVITDPEQIFAVWLSNLGNQSLPVEDGHPTIENHKVDHRDVWMADFDVEATRMGSHPDTDWPTDTRPDLLLSKEGVDYGSMYRHTLVSVNGLLHRTSYSQSGLYVLDGNYGAINGNRTQMALTDFTDVGELTFVNLNPSMLYRPKEGVMAYNYAHLNLGVETEGKVVMLVIGGYPHLLDNTYKTIGNGLVQIDFNNYPMIQRFYESRDLIDQSSITYKGSSNNPSQVRVSDLLASEQTIEQLLSLSQSFAVIIDAKDLYVEKRQVEKSDLPGLFLSRERPVFPLVTQRGKWAPYWTRQEEDVWVIKCESNLVPNYQFEHTGYRDLYAVTDHKVPHKPYYHDRGWLLEIGKDIVK